MVLRIKAVIFNHNRLATAERLFELLAPVFDTALFDSGSHPAQVSTCTTHRFENLYWTGCWNQAMRLFGDSDVVWGIGGDCTLDHDPERIREAMETAFPFGTWSPAINGRAHEYMKPPVGYAKVFSVRYLEGIAFAISQPLWKIIEQFDPVNYIGHGHDLRACFLARETRMKNILDGRVSLSHPPSSDYDLELARVQMFESLNRTVGNDWSDSMEWWWGKRISFLSNVVSEISLEGGVRKFHRPFVQRDQ